MKRRHRGIFSLCRKVKQGIDCDSVQPEGCVLTVWNPTRSRASLSAATVLAVEIVLFLTWTLFFVPFLLNSLALFVSLLFYRDLKGQKG